MDVVCTSTSNIVEERREFQIVQIVQMYELLEMCVHKSKCMIIYKSYRIIYRKMMMSKRRHED
jgi:hypothetical protein